MNDASSDSRNATAAASSDGAAQRSHSLQALDDTLLRHRIVGVLNLALDHGRPVARRENGVPLYAVCGVLHRNRSDDCADSSFRDRIDADLWICGHVMQRARADRLLRRASSSMWLITYLQTRNTPRVSIAMARSNHSSRRLSQK